MTEWTHRTIIVPAAFAPMARALAAVAGPAGSGAGMFQAMLSPTAGKPPTHYISAGLIWPEFAYLLPTHDSEMWVQPEPVDGQEPAQPPVDSAGHPEEVVSLAVNAMAAQVEKALIAALPQSDEPTPPEQLEAIKAQAQEIAQASPPVTLEQVHALFGACRVYTCGWQQAIEHMGLRAVVEQIT